ncbi:MAG: MarR family transcriptional regulator [Chloroflexi bacterium]|nr:MarR family transcriptional regulator [Chloroflexota bacterium]
MPPARVQILFGEMMSLIYEREIRLMREFGLSLLEYYTLQIMSFTQEASLKEIGHRLALPKSTVTFIADSLERRGLVERQRNKDDRRIWQLRLTELGRRRIAELLAKKAAYTLPILEALSDAEAQTLVKVMEDITQRLRDSR